MSSLKDKKSFKIELAVALIPAGVATGLAEAVIGRDPQRPVYVDSAITYPRHSSADFGIVAGSSQGGEDDIEGVGALDPCGIDGRSHVGFGFCSPRAAVAVGDLSLDHARSEPAFRRVVGGVDLAGIIAKGEKLVSRPPDFGLQFSGPIAPGWRGQKDCELLFQLALFPRER
jgi:hypothetical protein